MTINSIISELKQDNRIIRSRTLTENEAFVNFSENEVEERKEMSKKFETAFTQYIYDEEMFVIQIKKLKQFYIEESKKRIHSICYMNEEDTKTLTQICEKEIDVIYKKYEQKKVDIIEISEGVCKESIERIFARFYEINCFLVKTELGNCLKDCKENIYLYLKGKPDTKNYLKFIDVTQPLEFVRDFNDKIRSEYFNLFLQKLTSNIKILITISSNTRNFKIFNDLTRFFITNIEENFFRFINYEPTTKTRKRENYLQPLTLSLGGRSVTQFPTINRKSSTVWNNLLVKSPRKGIRLKPVNALNSAKDQRCSEMLKTSKKTTKEWSKYLITNSLEILLNFCKNLQKRKFENHQFPALFADIGENLRQLDTILNESTEISSGWFFADLEQGKNDKLVAENLKQMSLSEAGVESEKLNADLLQTAIIDNFAVEISLKDIFFGNENISKAFRRDLQTYLKVNLGQK